jgi:hypothetical protein
MALITFGKMLKQSVLFGLRRSPTVQIATPGGCLQGAQKKRAGRFRPARPPA